MEEDKQSTIIGQGEMIDNRPIPFPFKIVVHWNINSTPDEREKVTEQLRQLLDEISKTSNSLLDQIEEINIIKD